MTEKQAKAEALAWAEDIKDRVRFAVGEPEIDEDGDTYETFFIGTVLDMSPSGKYYAPWTSNQSSEDVIYDEIFWETLDDILCEELPGYYLFHSEGDPLDILISHKIKSKGEPS